MAALNETDLYAPVKKCWRSKVIQSGTEVDCCDLMTVRGGEPPVIFELQGLDLSIVYQGIERQRITDAVYLAVAAPTGPKVWAMEPQARSRATALSSARADDNQMIVVSNRFPCLRGQNVATLDGRQAKGVQPDKRGIRRTLVITMEERLSARRCLVRVTSTVTNSTVLDFRARKTER